MARFIRISSIMIVISAVCLAGTACSQQSEVSQRDLQIGGMPLLSTTIQSRAITAENTTGAKGQGGQSHGGRKGSPCLWNLEKDQTYTFAEIEGPGVIRHIWITIQNFSPTRIRDLILRVYWDDQETPSIEAPLVDFFGMPHGRLVEFESEFLIVPEGKGLNCYFPMPFKEKAKFTITNESGQDAGMFFYQVDYTLGDHVTDDTPYFHAQFRRVPHTTLTEDYVILDGVQGKGRYLGMNFGLIDRFAGKGVWWGEGEVKMYIDGDTKYPTICGTGSEDYAGTAWGMGKYDTAHFGSLFEPGKYIAFYRFHVKDPVYFTEDIKVTIQQLGNEPRVTAADPEGPMGELIKKGYYRKDRKAGHFERVDDVCSTAYWYQTLPTQPFPPLPDKELRRLDLE